MFSFEPGMAIWTLVSFLLVVFLLSKFILPPLMRTIEERKQRIAGDLETADREARTAEQMTADLAKRLAAIELERERLLSEAREQARARYTDLERETLDEINTIRRLKEAQFAAEREQFLNQTGDLINRLIIAGCERVLKTGLTPEQQQAVLEYRISELEKMTKI